MRRRALRRWRGSPCALDELRLVLDGGATNKGLLLDLLAADAIRRGGVDVEWLDRTIARPAAARARRGGADRRRDTRLSGGARHRAAQLLRRDAERRAALDPRFDRPVDRAHVPRRGLPPARPRHRRLELPDRARRARVPGAMARARTARRPTRRRRCPLPADAVARAEGGAAHRGQRPRASHRPRYRRLVRASAPAVVIALDVDGRRGGRRRPAPRPARDDEGRGRLPRPLQPAPSPRCVVRRNERVAAGAALVQHSGRRRDGRCAGRRAGRVALPDWDRSAAAPVRRRRATRPRGGGDPPAAGARARPRGASAPRCGASLLGYDQRPDIDAQLRAVLDGAAAARARRRLPRRSWPRCAAPCACSPIPKCCSRASPTPRASGAIGPSNDAWLRLYLRRIGARGAGPARSLSRPAAPRHGALRLRRSRSERRARARPAAALRRTRTRRGTPSPGRRPAALRHPARRGGRRRVRRRRIRRGAGDLHRAARCGCRTGSPMPRARRATPSSSCRRCAGAPRAPPRRSNTRSSRSNAARRASTSRRCWRCRTAHRRCSSASRAWADSGDPLASRPCPAGAGVAPVCAAGADRMGECRAAWRSPGSPGSAARRARALPAGLRGARHRARGAGAPIDRRCGLGCAVRCGRTRGDACAARAHHQRWTRAARRRSARAGRAAAGAAIAARAAIVLHGAAAGRQPDIRRVRGCKRPPARARRPPRPASGDGATARPCAAQSSSRSSVCQAAKGSTRSMAAAAASPATSAFSSSRRCAPPFPARRASSTSPPSSMRWLRPCASCAPFAANATSGGGCTGTASRWWSGRHCPCCRRRSVAWCASSRRRRATSAWRRSSSVSRCYERHARLHRAAARAGHRADRRRANRDRVARSAPRSVAAGNGYRAAHRRIAAARLRLSVRSHTRCSPPAAAQFEEFDLDADAATER